MSGVFLRKETKYMLTLKQYNDLISVMEGKMTLDKYGKQTMNNVYFDNDCFELISRSVEKPVYKEKVRLRVYGKPEPDSPAYLELKKKYKGVVYKRRISAPLYSFTDYIEKGIPPCDSQIFREIDYVYRVKNLAPKVYLAYEREAFYGNEDAGFRITFDTGIRYRTGDTSILSPAAAEKLIDDDSVLMETKCLLAYPRWLIDFLCDNNIYKTSFSKYGRVYTDRIIGSVNIEEKEEKIICSN